VTNDDSQNKPSTDLWTGSFVAHSAPSRFTRWTRMGSCRAKTTITSGLMGTSLRRLAGAIGHDVAPMSQAWV